MTFTDSLQYLTISLLALLVSIWFYRGLRTETQVIHRLLFVEATVSQLTELLRQTATTQETVLEQLKLLAEIERACLREKQGALQGQAGGKKRWGGVESSIEITPPVTETPPEPLSPNV